MAHVWPNHLGGILVTLACKKCNSEIGSRLESKMNGRTSVTISYPGEKGFVRAKWSLQDNNTIYQEASKPVPHNPAYRRDRLNWQKMKETGEGDAFEVSISQNDINDSKLINAAFLHGAYLFLFHHFGYHFLKLNVAEKMRKQIFYPLENHYPVRRDVATFDDSMYEDGDPVFCGVTKPNFLQGFFIGSPKLKGLNGLRDYIILPLTKSFDGQDIKVNQRFSVSPANDLLFSDESIKDPIVVLNAILKRQS